MEKVESNVKFKGGYEMLYTLDKKDGGRLIPLFEKMHDTMIWSYLGGHMGSAIVDDVEQPKMGQIVLGDFVFLAGDVTNEAAIELLENLPLEKFIITENRAWKDQIEKIYKEDVIKIVRYAFKKDLRFLRCNHLRNLIQSLSEEYDLKRMEGSLLRNTSLHELSKDFTGQFESLEDFEKRGRGYCILHKGKVVCGASSYSIYSGGLEIEVDTHPNYMRRGLATVATAALMLECLEEGLYPNYDAAHLASVGVAQKLGYQLERAYDTYMIRKGVLKD